MKRKPVCVVLIAAFILVTIGISQSKIVHPQQRFRCKAVIVKIKGACPDSIEASVYDIVSKDTLRYKFKTSGRANKTGQFMTTKADATGDVIAGQIIDASANTIGMILMQSNNATPVIKYRGEF